MNTTGHKGNRGTTERIQNLHRGNSGARAGSAPPADFRAEQQAAQRARRHGSAVLDSEFQDQQDRQEQTSQTSQTSQTGRGVPLSDVEIVNLKRLHGDGPTKAFFSLALFFGSRGPKGTAGDPLLLHDCRLLVDRDGEPFVAMPQREWTDGQGTRKYSPNAELPKTWRRPALDAVIDALGGWPLS